MMKKATPEFAAAETFVWWDMDSCPLPLGYDPSRVGPRIDTELKNLGYNGPLTIVGLGILAGIPHDYLKALSSGGVVIKQLSLGSHMIEDVLDAFDSNEPPMSMMIITAAHPSLLDDVICEFYDRGSSGYNLLLAYPYVTEHDPEPSSLLDHNNFGGQFIWDRLGLLKDHPGSANNETRRQETGCELHCCGLCEFSSDSFDDFATHLTTRPHADMMDEYLNYIEEKRYLEVKAFKALELDKSYLAKVEAKKQELIEYANFFKSDSDVDTHKPKKSKRRSKHIKLQSKGKKFKVALLCKSYCLKKKSSAKPKKLSKLETAEE